MSEAYFFLDQIGFPPEPFHPEPPLVPQGQRKLDTPTPPSPGRTAACLQLAAPKPRDAQPGPAQFPRPRGSRGVPRQGRLGGIGGARTFSRSAAGQKRAEGKSPSEGLSRRASRGALTCAVRWSLPGPRRPQAGATSEPDPPLPPEPTQRECTPVHPSTVAPSQRPLLDAAPWMTTLSKSVCGDVGWGEVGEGRGDVGGPSQAC